MTTRHVIFIVSVSIVGHIIFNVFLFAIVMTIVIVIVISIITINVIVVVPIDGHSVLSPRWLGEYSKANKNSWPLITIALLYVGGQNWSDSS